MRFCITHLPFLYLGAPIFKGRPKSIHFESIVDKTRIQLASWKAIVVSMTRSGLSIKNVIQGMVMHTIMVYSWPNSLLKDIQKWCENFIWSDDTLKKKLVTIAQRKCYLDLTYGGLGITSINEASNPLQCWNMTDSKYHRVTIFKHKVHRQRGQIKHNILSSICSGLKSCISGFWLDNWCDLVKER